MTRAASLLGLMIALALAFGACGDGEKKDGGDGAAGPLTLEQYFDKLQPLATKLDEDGNALDQRIRGTLDIDEAKSVFGEYVTVLEGFVDELETLEPPAQAQQAHDGAVAAGRAFAAEFQRAVDQGRDAETFEDLFAGAEGESFGAASEAFTATCFALEQVADDNGITVDLGCRE